MEQAGMLYMPCTLQERLYLCLPGSHDARLGAEPLTLVPMYARLITASCHARRRLLPHTATATQCRANSGGTRLGKGPGADKDAD
jgi:hypothetical protein